MQHLIFLDAESYYDAEFSLRRMTPAEYILDGRFAEIMWAVRVVTTDQGKTISEAPHQVVDAPDFPQWLAQFDPKITTTVTFNALFDNSILAWRHGFVPSTMICTLSMVRALMGHLMQKFNLAEVAQHLNLAAKGTTIADVRGFNRQQIMSDPVLWSNFKQYAIRDNEINEQILWRLLPSMPASERRLMDMVLRCCIEPRFLVDGAMLGEHIKQVRLDKEQLLVDAGNIDKKIVASTKKFQEALEALGVTVEYKDSPTAVDPITGLAKKVPAFAKSDEFMETLQNSNDPAVAALAAARLGHKSTLEESRSATLWRISQLPWRTLPSGQIRLYSGGTMPIPLAYGKAHTHRLAGDWRMNMQNMPTVRGSKGKSKLRQSLRAPPGHQVVTADLGQIEARLVAWICREERLLNEFANKLDPYNQLATAIFGRPVNRKLVGTLDEIMGFIGKTGILGLGYGAGKDKFDAMVIQSARAQMVDISQIYNRAIGDKAVDTYRHRYPMIPAGWQDLNYAIAHFWMPVTGGGTGRSINFGPVTIKQGEVVLPNGLSMMYGDCRRDFVKNSTGGSYERWEYSYRYGKKRHRLYGAKLLENIVQALARIIVMNAALRIRGRGKAVGENYEHCFRFVLQAHDELVYIIPDEILDEAKKMIHAEMVRPPSWGRTIPLTADIGVGPSYGEAKG